MVDWWQKKELLCSFKRGIDGNWYYSLDNLLGCMLGINKIIWGDKMKVRVYYNLHKNVYSVQHYIKSKGSSIKYGNKNLCDLVKFTQDIDAKQKIWDNI